MRDFRKYEVWKLSHEFVLEIYKLTKAYPNSEQFGVTSQIRRASVSIPTNFAEGCGRQTDADFVRFIHISLGSAHEVEYLLQLSHDLDFIDQPIYLLMSNKINVLKRKLFHLEKSIKTQNVR